MSRESSAKHERVLADEGFVREDRRRLISLPETDADAFRAAFDGLFDMGDGRPYFVFEDVVAVRGRRAAVVCLHLEYATGERGGSHLLVWLFDEPVLKWQRMVAFDPEDVDAAIAELDALPGEIDD